MLARRGLEVSPDSFADAFNVGPPKGVVVPRNTTPGQPANSCNPGEISGTGARGACLQFVGRGASVRKLVSRDQISGESVERLTGGSSIRRGGDRRNLGGSPLRGSAVAGAWWQGAHAR